MPTPPRQRRTAPDVPAHIPVGSPEYRRRIRNMDIEFTGTLECVLPSLTRRVCARAMALRVADWENVLGEVLLWAWLNAHAMPSDEEEFVRWIMGVVKTIAVSQFEKPSANLDLLPDHADPCAPHRYTPPLRREGAADHFEGRLASMVQTLGGAPDPWPSERIDKLCDRLAEAVARDLLDVDAAIATAALALLAERPWPRVAAQGRTRLQVMQTARVLFEIRDLAHRDMVGALMDRLGLSQRSARAALDRVLGIVRTLTAAPAAQHARAS